MAHFMARIELHGATYQDYANLHNYMRQAGFATTIRADNGAVFNLPPAEYNIVANYSKEQVLQAAKTAAQRTLKKFAAVVSEYNSCCWDGLVPAQQRASA